MHRSASWSKVVDDEYFTTMEGKSSELPLYDNDSTIHSDIAKKDKPTRFKFAENSVHIIPFVLFLCAFILWFFSNPDVEVEIKADSVASRIEGLTIEGDIDTDSDGTQTGFLPIDMIESESTTNKQLRLHKNFRKLATQLH